MVCKVQASDGCCRFDDPYSLAYLVLILHNVQQCNAHSAQWGTQWVSPMCLGSGRWCVVGGGRGCSSIKSLCGVRCGAMTQPRDKTQEARVKAKVSRGKA